jgi:hypothetical protein
VCCRTPCNLTVRSSQAWSGKIAFDYKRHRRELNLQKDYTRLNQWPEWYTVDEDSLNIVRDADSGKQLVRFGSDLRAGFEVAVPAGAARRLVVHPAR